MRKFLSLAFLLLTLLCGTEVQAQTYYTENGQIYGDYDNSDYYSDNVRCSWCGVLMTQEEYAYHDCDERTSVNGDDDIFFRGGSSSGSVHVYDDGDVDYSGGGSPSGNTGSGETATKDKALGEVTVNGYYQGFNPLLDLLYYLLTGGYLPGGFNDLGSLSDNGESIEGNDTTNVGWYPPSNTNKWKKLTVQEMKNTPGVHYVSNLPSKFMKQVLEHECAANSIATVASIVDGCNPEETRSTIRYIADKAGYDLENRGIPLGDIKYLLYDYCAITDDNKFSRNAVESYIDNENKPIMAVTEVEFTNKRGEYFLGAHMVTIVAYDALYYYCAYGGSTKEKEKEKDIAAIPKTEFEIKNPSSGTMKYNLYIYNGKKRLNR